MVSISQLWSETSRMEKVVLSIVIILSMIVIIMIVLQGVGYGPYAPNILVEPITAIQRAKYNALSMKLDKPALISDTGTSADYNLSTAKKLILDAEADIDEAMQLLSFIPDSKSPDDALEYANDADEMARSALQKVLEAERLLELAKKDILGLELAVPTVERLSVSTVGQAQSMINDLNQTIIQVETSIARVKNKANETKNITSENKVNAETNMGLSEVQRESVRQNSNEVYIRMVSLAAELTIANKNLFENNADIRFARNSGNTNSVRSVYEDVESRYAKMEHIYNSMLSDASLVRSNIDYIQMPPDQARPMLLNIDAVMNNAKRQMSDAGYMKDNIYESLQMAKAVQTNNLEDQAQFLKNNIDKWNNRIISQVRNAQLPNSPENQLQILMATETEISRLYQLMSNDLADIDALPLKFDTSVQIAQLQNAVNSIDIIKGLINAVQEDITNSEYTRIAQLEKEAMFQVNELIYNVGEIVNLVKRGNVILVDASNATVSKNATELQSLLKQANSIKTQGELYYDTCVSIEKNIKKLISSETFPKFSTILNQINIQMNKASTGLEELGSLPLSVDNMINEVNQFVESARTAEITQLIDSIVRNKTTTLKMRDRSDAELANAQDAVISLNGPLIELKYNAIVNYLEEARTSHAEVLRLVGQLKLYDPNLATQVQVYQSDSSNALNHIIDVQRDVADMINNLSTIRAATLMNKGIEKLNFMKSHNAILFNIKERGISSVDTVSEASGRLNVDTISTTIEDYSKLLESAEQSYIHINQSYDSIVSLLGNEAGSFNDILLEADDIKQQSTIIINEIRSYDDSIEGTYQNTQTEKRNLVLNQASVFIEQIDQFYNNMNVLLNESKIAVNRVVPLETAKIIEQEQLARLQNAQIIQENITYAYSQFRDYLSINQYLELGTEFQIAKSKQQESGSFLDQIAVMTQQISQNRISLQSNMISESFSQVNNLVGNIEYKNNELTSLVAQSENIISNVNGVITTEDPIYVLDYIRNKNGSMNLLNLAGEDILYEINEIMNQLELFKSIMSELDAIINNAINKYPNYMSKLDTIKQNQYVLNGVLSDAEIREQQIRNNIAVASNHLNDIKSLRSFISNNYNEGVSLYNTLSTAMSDYNWSSVDLNGPSMNNIVNIVQPKFDQLVQIRNTISGLLTSGHPDSNNVLIAVEEEYGNSYNMLEDLKIRAHTVNKWISQVQVIKSLLNILNLQETNVGMARDAKNAGLQIRSEATSLYNSYQWDVLNTKLEDLIDYKDTATSMLSIVKQQHTQIMSAPQTGYVQNILSQSQSNINEAQSAVDSLSVDISTLTNLINQSSQLQQVESNFSEILDTNAQTVNNVINKSMTNIYTINSLVEMGTAAAGKGNSSAVYQYESQSYDVMSQIQSDYQGLGTVVEDSRQIMNDYVRDLNNFDQTNFDSIESGYASMSSIIAAAQNILSNWGQIINSL